MKCPQCEKTVLDSSKFCPFCGTTLIAAAPEPQAQPEPQPQAQPRPDTANTAQGPAGEQEGYYQQAEQNYQQYQQNNYQPYPPYAATPEQPPETTKPRSAYWAAILHLFFGTLGFGYNYRGMKDKAKNCIIMLIVGIATSWIFGLGGIVIAVCQIINIVEAVKLFNGTITADAYGRTLYQEF